MEGCFLDWKSMTSHVPCGAVLVLLLFGIYINDLSKFVDDTNITDTVNNEDVQ